MNISGIAAVCAHIPNCVGPQCQPHLPNRMSITSPQWSATASSQLGQELGLSQLGIQRLLDGIHERHCVEVLLRCHLPSASQPSAMKSLNRTPQPGVSKALGKAAQEAVYLCGSLHAYSEVLCVLPCTHSAPPLSPCGESRKLTNDSPNMGEKKAYTLCLPASMVASVAASRS